MNEEDLARLDHGFLLISFKKRFFPKFELLNSGCGLSTGFYGVSIHIICLLDCIDIVTRNFYSVTHRSSGIIVKKI